ncbi:MAG: FAD-dependent oxidoreductase, partial [Campylobacter sp.]
MQEYDIIVVGGGHAGIEASLAPARMGKKTLLITILAEQIGATSCNPAVGGLAKGHLVKELDALGGQMGLTTDAVGIQFRVLNESKGPAVRGSRAQIDMDRYRVYMRNLLLNTPNLDVTQEIATQILTQNGQISGVKTHLGNEPAHESYMREKPRRRDANLISPSMTVQIVCMGAWLVLLSFFFLTDARIAAAFDGKAEHYTAYFLLFVLASLMNGFNVRSTGFGIFRDLSENVGFLKVWAGILLIMAAIINAP